VAVVQISKIQVRRGQKNSNSGVPQLSSAEFAWAVDTQELYIGNGSVQEGAPYVGNTKILTEHDNILDLATSYQFASNDTSITLSVPRSLQAKADEYVSVLDFGAVGDGSTDNVSAFETAFEQLFRNANEDYKKVLMVPNGDYLFSSDLEIPSGVILRGETQLGAKLIINNRNIQFVTSTGASFALFDSSNRPTNIEISNLTIQRTTGQVVLSGVANSLIKNVKFLGEYELGDSVTSIDTEAPAVFWLNNLIGTRVQDVTFDSCVFESNSLSVKCSQSTAFDSNVYFKNCDFFINHTGIYVSGVVGQGNKWIINDCNFEEIARQAFKSSNGKGTKIQRCKFENVGNDTNDASSPVEPMVYFGEKTGNLVLNSISNRQQEAGITTSNLTPAVNEVWNGDKVSFIDRNIATLFISDSFRPLSVFSAFNKYIYVDYFMTLGSYSRVGTLIITLGDDITELSIADNYSYSSPGGSSPGTALMTNFEFTAELKDNDDNTGDSALAPDTVLLSYKNPLPGAQGTISFDVSYGV
jgi:hypothetical protein